MRIKLSFVLFLVVFLAIVIFSVASAETLRVVLDNNYPPYSFFDSSGKPIGICVDLWKKWESITGVKVNLIMMDWENAIPMVENGEADVVDEIFYSKKRAEKLDFTASYDVIKTRIFFDERLSGITNDLNTIKGFRIGVKIGDYDANYLIEHGIKELAYYATYSELVKAAKEGKIHIFVMDEPAAFYYLSKYGLLDKFKYTDLLFPPEKLYRAVRKGDRKTLELVNKGFSKIPHSYVESVMKKWKGQPLEERHFWNEIWIFLIVALLIGGMAVVFFLWNRILTFTVKKRTKELEKEIEKSREAKEKVSELSDKLREVTEHLYELNEKITKMIKLISEISPFSDEKEFANDILELALKFVPEADGGSMSIVEGEKWKYLAIKGEYDAEKIMNLDLKAEWMVKVDKVEVIDHILEKDENIMPLEIAQVLKMSSKRKIVKSLTVPIQINGKYAGNIFLDAYKDVDFSEGSKYMMEIFGNITSAFFTIKRINTLELEHQRELLREIVNLVESSVPQVRGHSERVAVLSEAIGKEMGLSLEDVEDLKWCAIFHDIGFVGIPDSIHRNLASPFSLPEDEIDALKTHPLLGEFILSFSTLPKRYQKVVRHHHENYDGTGYPDGLKGDEIPFFSRIIAIANAFDELISIREMDVMKAIEEIKKGRGSLYDPTILEVALKIFKDFASKLRK